MTTRSRPEMPEMRALYVFAAALLVAALAGGCVAACPAPTRRSGSRDSGRASSDAPAR